MALKRKIWNLDYRQFFILCRVFLVRPRLIIPTYKATRETLAICNSEFGSKHHGDTKANAFRHALWNYLICKNAFAVLKNKQEAIAWAKKITDLHEKLSPNEEFSMLMDLHNNRIGRKLFENFPLEMDMAGTLKEKKENAVKVTHIEELKEYREKLVFIELYS